VDWIFNKGGKTIIPVLLQDCEADDFHIGMVSLQHVDFSREWELGRKKLLQTIGRLTAQQQKAHSPKPERKPGDQGLTSCPQCKKQFTLSSEHLGVMLQCTGCKTNFIGSPGCGLALEITNSLGMKFAWIPPGTFLMGSPKDEKDREGYDGADETQHKVTLTKGFFMSVHQVTRGQFATFVEKSGYKTQAEKEGGAYIWTGKEWKLDATSNWRSPGFEQTNDHPVVCVSWNDGVEFAKWLAEREKKTVRLPTEAEWEYSCRAGTTTPFHFGQTVSTEQANYDGNYTYGTGKKGVFRQKTTPVGSFPANAFGLFDMHGNAWDWCHDWFGKYPQGEVLDPQGPGAGQHRVVRGGSWTNNPQYCRSAFRCRIGPGYRSSNFGLRVCFCLD
jgi:formylglycine-generating enzyme required for sulfatase activity